MCSAEIAMTALSPKQMLRVWEKGQGQPPVARALLLLSEAEPEIGRADLAALPIGARDDRLLALREATFGPHLTSLASCPSCGEKLELNFRVSDVRVAPSTTGALEYSDEGYRIGFRLPSSADIEALTPGRDARMDLLERCVTSATCKGAKQSLDQIPVRQLDALAARMAEADPGADLKAALACPACGHGWEAVFDIVSFFWTELGTHVRNLLREIHVLARAYGWREEDILDLSPWRRKTYLGLVGQ